MPTYKLLNLSGKLGAEKSALVDECVFDYLSQWKWYLTKNGYVSRWERFPKRGIYIHRFIILPPLPIIIPIFSWSVLIV